MPKEKRITVLMGDESPEELEAYYKEEKRLTEYWAKRNKRIQFVKKWVKELAQILIGVVLALFTQWLAKVLELS